MDRPLNRLLIAGCVTAIADGLFATTQTILRGAPVLRLWQGVAATILGPPALEGGMATALIGIVMHIGVAFFWSAMFLLIETRSDLVQRIVTSPAGVLQLAAIYGPGIWLIMSLAVIPLLVHRPPVITSRWWVQFFGHAIFVGLPIVSIIGGMRRAGYNHARA
jgi:hypothetical protein